MQINKKVLMGLIVLGISFFVSSNAYASYNWKDYFSTNQVTAIKKGASQSIINKFKTDSDWKDVISGRNIKDNAITAEKIKDGTITGSDLSGNIGVSTTGNIETTGTGTITSAGAMGAANGLSAGGVVNFRPADIVKFPTAILGDPCTEDGAVGVYPAGNAGQRILVCDGANWIAN